MLTGNYTRNQGLVCLLSWKTSLTSSEAIGPLEGRVKAAAVASIAAWGRVSYQFISCEAAVAKTTWLQLASNPSIPRWYRLNYSDRNLTGNPQDMIKHSVWKSLEKVSFQIVKIEHFWHFQWTLSTQNVNVARFARNVEWDFFCNFQTLC